MRRELGSHLEKTEIRVLSLGTFSPGKKEGEKKKKGWSHAVVQKG